MLTAEDYRTATSALDWHELFPTWLTAASNLGTNRYWVPPHAEHLVLVEDSTSTIRALSNVCTHRQALIMGGSIGEQNGKIGSRLVCPVHRWNWDTTGQFAGARGFCINAQHDLKSYPLSYWQGHIWTGPDQWQQDLGSLQGIEQLVSVEGLVPSNNTEPVRKIIAMDFDWKIFMEIYLDLYHIAPAHPGLSGLTDPRQFGYYTGQGWSCQTAAFNRRGTVANSYRDLARIYKSSGLWDSAKYGAVWLGIYPNTMLEYYPGVTVVSTVWPRGVQQCVNNLEFYYNSELVDSYPNFPTVFERYFMATSDEDEAIGQHMQAGRNSLRGQLPVLYHNPEESGIAHFHQWLSDNELVVS